MIKPLRLSFCFIVMCNSSFAQKKLMVMDENGRSLDFSMGKYEYKSDKCLSIRPDSIYKLALETDEMRITFAEPNFVAGDIPGWKGYAYSINSEGNVLTKNPLHVRGKALEIDLAYTNTNKTCQRLLTLGNPNLPASLRKQIKWIDLDLSNGRISNFSDYENLEVIHSQKVDVMGINRSEPGFQFEGYSLFSYRQDPFLWKGIEKLSKLKMLHLHITGRNESMYSNGNLYASDGPSAAIFSLPKLTSISLRGISFLPVNFKDYKKIKYFDTENLFVPELINVALVFYASGKDTNLGNWGTYLSHADISHGLKIPENGLFQSYYRGNKQLLCSGEFKENLPDGSWKFWYADGRLCQERHYDRGQAMGDWIFCAPDGDTILILSYLNGNLIHRTERKYRGIASCISSETLPVEQINHYKFDWKNEQSVLINHTCYFIDNHKYSRKKNSKDTLQGFEEKWIYDPGLWEYYGKDFCKKGTESKTIHLKGDEGKLAHFSDCIRYYNNSSFNIFQKEQWSIDMKNCIWEHVKYSNENPEHELRMIENKKQLIHREKGFCIN